MFRMLTSALQDDERMVSEAGVGFLDVGCGETFDTYLPKPWRRTPSKSSSCLKNVSA